MDDASACTLVEALSDLRDAIVEHCACQLSWRRPANQVTGSGFEYELRVRLTRRGNLLELADRKVVPAMNRHRIRVGEGVG